MYLKAVDVFNMFTDGITLQLSDDSCLLTEQKIEI